MSTKIFLNWAIDIISKYIWAVNLKLVGNYQKAVPLATPLITADAILELPSTRPSTSPPSRFIPPVNAGSDEIYEDAVQPPPMLSSDTETRSRSLRTRTNKQNLAQETLPDSSKHRERNKSESPENTQVTDVPTVWSPPPEPVFSKDRFGSMASLLHALTTDGTARDNDLREKLIFKQSTSQSDQLCTECKGTTAYCSNGRLTFNNRVYHKDCFVCVRCRKQIAGTQPSGFTLTDDGRPQCSQCDLVLTKSCYACNKLILKGGTIIFDTKSYHTNCFRCAQCHRLLEDEKGLYTHNSKPHCKRCHKEHFAPRCIKCSEPITTAKYITFKNQNYHNACFVCVKCHRVIDSTESFYNTELGFTCTMCDV